MRDLLEFPKDLALLYASTGSKDVELCFVKVAQNFNQELLTWINSKEARSIPLFSDVLSALQYLAVLRQKYPGQMSTTDFLKSIMGTSSIKLFPTIISFQSIIDNPILQPFEDIINAASNHIVDAPIMDNSAIQNDLLKIHSVFRDHMEHLLNKPYDESVPKKKIRQTKKTKMLSLFSYLVKEFSSEFSNAYQKIGQGSVSSEIAQGTIADPSKMSGLIGANFDFSFIAKKANQVCKDALKKDITNHESIYNFIRNTALQFGGEITQEDVAQNEYDNLTSVDFSYFMDNELAAISPSVNRFKVNQKQLTNHISVMLVSTVLYMLFSKINN